MQVFGSKYLTDNPDNYMTATGAYALSYAIMMLQTSLYNPQIKENERMTRDQFVKLVKGINDGKDIPQEVAASIFDRTQKKPLAIHSQEAAQ